MKDFIEYISASKDDQIKWLTEQVKHFQDKVYKECSCTDCFEGFCSFCGKRTHVEYTGTRGNYSSMMDAVFCENGKCNHNSKERKRYNYRTGEKL